MNEHYWRPPYYEFFLSDGLTECINIQRYYDLLPERQTIRGEASDYCIRGRSVQQQICSSYELASTIQNKKVGCQDRGVGWIPIVCGKADMIFSPGRRWLRRREPN
jgi:hypothetical protein